MQIKFFCPLWGSDKMSFESFIEEVKNVSVKSIKVMHESIKHKLVDLFDKKSDNFERSIGKNLI